MMVMVTSSDSAAATREDTQLKTRFLGWHEYHECSNFGHYFIR